MDALPLPSRQRSTCCHRVRGRRPPSAKSGTDIDVVPSKQAAEHLLPQSKEATPAFSQERNKYWYMLFALSIWGGSAGAVLPNVTLASLNGGVNPCVKYGSDSESCTRSLQIVTEWGSMTGSISSFSMFFIAPFVAAVADVIGRKPILTVQLFMQTAQILVLLGTINNLCSIYLFWCIGVLSFGGMFDVVSLLVMSDFFPVEDFHIGVAASAGITSLGSIIGGVLAATTSAFTCIIIGAIMLFSALCVFATLGETLAEENKKQTFDMQTQIAKIRSFATLTWHPRYRTIFVIVFVSLVTLAGEGATEGQAMIAIYGMDQHSLSVAGMIINWTGAATNIFLLPVLGNIIGTKGVLLFTSVIGVVALFGTGFAPSVHVVYFFKCFDGLFKMYLPTCTAVFYRATPEHLRSEAMGMRISLASLAGMLGSAVYGSIFVYFEQPRFWFSSPFPQSCLTVGSIVWTFICVAFLFIPKEVCAGTEELVDA